jgi:Domain of unknown function (DUF4389)
MKPGRVVAIVIAALIAIPALGMVFGGTVLGIASVVERDDNGYFDATLERLSTATSAITTGEADLRAEPGPPAWFLDFLDVTVRIRVDGTDGDIFVGIGPESDVNAYLDGVARDEIVHVDRSRVDYRAVEGDATPAPPDDQSFWVASASGSSPQELTWDVTDGSWVAVLMNVDGSPGLLAEVTVGVRSGALVPIAIALVATGVVLLVIAVVVIVLAVTAGRRPEEAEEPAAGEALVDRTGEPVLLEARIDSPSQWLWLVKWFLAIPHFVVLALLWLVFFVLTFIAWFAILFTGRYPRTMFDFNVGVMRWTWRVAYYFGPGGLGTDRYPPFTTEDVPDYPARLDVAYPEHLSRGLVLVKSWLLAIPHYIVLAVLLGWGYRSWYPDSWSDGTTGGVGLLGVLVFIAAVILLFTGKYPRPLFDFIIGLNRWIFRVEAYVFLMTDVYPPFRLDQGGTLRPRAEEGSPSTVDG